uniref:Pentacotripeptide-repeat region of PRORP domain-containing protein n=1 Tax=Arcella intermedia TaxID=1963864 RepID=A0A6B2L4B1_9EUKA
MLNVCSYTDQMDRALEVYSDMMQRNVPPDSRVFSVMILGFTKARQYQRVIQIEDAVESLKVEYDQVLYMRFIMAYISGNLLTRAEKMFSMMQGNDKIPIDLSIYGIMIDALCEGSKVEEAVSLVNYLKLKGIKPNIIMYNNIIRGCRKVKNVSVAWGMFKDLEEQGLVPDDHTWHYLIDTLCVSGKVDTALKIKAMMESRGVKPSPSAYTAILIALSLSRRINDVERYFLEMRQLGYQCPSAWKFVVECYIKTKQMDKGLILVDQMIAESIKIPSMLKNILLVHCRKKNLESWYTQRFGPMPISETLLKRESAVKKFSQTFEDPRLDWDIDPETLSVIKPAKLKQEKEAYERVERLKNIEEEYITIPINPKLKEAMLEQQRLLAEERKGKKPTLKKKVKKLKASTKTTKTAKTTKTTKTAKTRTTKTKSKTK